MHTPRGRQQLVVRTLNAHSARGQLQLGWQRMPCALGRTGQTIRKREGDGASPVGTWPLRTVFYRAGRIPRPRCGLPLRQVRAADGWCDMPGDRNYNRFVRHPYPASAEHLWRTDGLYDVVVVLGHNDHRLRGCGSAIFLHCASRSFTPTAGCIAVRREDLVRLLPRLRLL